MDFDSAWCPTCDRQIIPKRYAVPLPTTPAPPSSPSSTSSVSSRKPSKRGGGLVRGTGRVNPNGSIKQPPAPAPTQPVKLRTVIDQGPYPLYCSDECRIRDLDSYTGALPGNYNPNRHSMPQLSRGNSDSEYVESPSMAHIISLYNFGPLPPPHNPPSPELPPAQPKEYTSGVMMANKYIEAMADQNKPPPPSDSRYPEPHPPTKIIPGWNDGSNAWRATVYSFSSNSSDSLNSTTRPRAYDGFLASPHRSERAASSAPDCRPVVDSSERDTLMSKYSASFNRRAGSAPSLSGLPPKRERPIVPAGVEGKLVVPNVMMKVRRGSSSSLSSISTRDTRPSIRSPLSVASSDEGDDDLPLEVQVGRTERAGSASASMKPKRPVVELRSWSYDNMNTYDIMPLVRGHPVSTKKLFSFAGKLA